jgi:glycosyltransferase involved in cell wall biosynthesis
MRVCMVSPHLAPEQTANAILPRQIGDALAARGVNTRYVVYPPSPGAHPPADVAYVLPRSRSRVGRTHVGAVSAASRMIIGARRFVRGSDVVHLHSNGLIVEVGQWLAARARLPYVITLYGTDVWHHDRAKHARFARVVTGAACRVFYSQGLLDFAKNVGLAPEPSRVIYAPVSSTFTPADEGTRAALRQELGAGDDPVILTVKRLHPVGGHEDLLRAVPAIIAAHPHLQVWLAGDGALRPQLESLAGELRITNHVRFLGRVGNDVLWRYTAAADLFVLPSRLESWGTVMLEALASGTRVVATATAGASEVQTLFHDDVSLVPVENPAALAREVSAQLAAGRRASQATLGTIADRFSERRCAAEYLQVYEQAIAAMKGLPVTSPAAMRGAR